MAARCGAAGQRAPHAARSAPPRRTPSHPPPAPLVPWPGAEELLHLVRSAGGWAHPSLVVGSRGGGRGVFSTSKLRSGPVMYVPLALCATVTAGSAAASLCAPGGPLAGLLDEEEQLALLLLMRCRNAPDAYTISLPDRSALRAFLPAWSRAELAALDDTPLAALAEAASSRHAKQHAALAAALAPAVVTLDEWLWALAVVLSRALRWHDGRGASLQPLIDLVNHAPFGDCGAGSRNAAYAYVAPGLTPAAAASAGWSELPGACATGGSAALVLLRPLVEGDELLTSYHQERPGGMLTAQAALARYGFLPDTLDARFAAPHDVHLADAINVALELKLEPSVSRAAAPSDKLRCAVAALTAAAAADDAAVRAAASNEPARLAALYRRGRRLALGRAALPHLPRDATCTGDTVRAGVALGIKAAASCFANAGAAAAFEAAVCAALVGEPHRLLTPDEAQERYRSIAIAS